MSRQPQKRRLARSAGLAPNAPLILIVCEGAKTEPAYLDGLRREWNLNINIVGGDECGTDPKQIVDFAKARVNRIRKRDRLEIKNENVWCVFDRDDHNIEHLNNALKMAKDNKFEVAFSNPCFELWLILHIKNQTAHIERDEMKRMFETHYPDDEKNHFGIFRKLENGIPDAVSRAEHLRERHNSAKDPEHTNPSTSVDRLIKHLIKIRDAGR